MFNMCQYLWPQDVCVDSGHPLRTDNYLKFVRELKQIGLDNGIVYNQSHAPFPLDVPEVRSYLKRAVECTAEAGGEICVIHPANNRSPEENAQMYLELLPFAKSCGVKLATENMWNWDAGAEYSSFAACATADSFCRHLEAVNDDFMVACLDIGHAEMRGSGDGAANMIRALGSKLQALHIHDNDRHHDNHQIPFSMAVDFEEIVRALKEIGYTGWLTLECGTYLDKRDKTDVFGAVCDMAESVKRLSKMF
jgi:sugar phosphate isomerase/epimerase